MNNLITFYFQIKCKKVPYSEIIAIRKVKGPCKLKGRITNSVMLNNNNNNNDNNNNKKNRRRRMSITLRKI